MTLNEAQIVCDIYRTKNFHKDNPKVIDFIICADQYVTRNVATNISSITLTAQGMNWTFKVMLEDINQNILEQIIQYNWTVFLSQLMLREIRPKEAL